jgi:hypothetical protein
MLFRRDISGATPLRFTRHVFYIPYVLAFMLVAAVGLQLTYASSAAPLRTGEVTLTMAKANYYVGENIRFTITNSSSVSVFIANNCPDVPLEVYRWELGAWQQLHKRVDESKCLNEPRSYEIKPGATVSTSYIYWPDLFAHPGHYRLVAPLEQQDINPSVEFDIAAQS